MNARGFFLLTCKPETRWSRSFFSHPSVTGKWVVGRESKSDLRLGSVLLHPGHSGADTPTEKEKASPFVFSLPLSLFLFCLVLLFICSHKTFN